MKYLLLLSIITIFLSSFSCKKGVETNAIVIRDCTGIYMRWDGLDHRVCNPGKLRGIESGTAVNARFSPAGSGKCAAKDDAVCLMLHDFPVGDWIVVHRLE